MCCNDKDFSEKLILFAEGDLPEDERQAFSEHLEKCPPCREKARELSEIVETLKENSRHIRENWHHISPSELITLNSQPESIDNEKRSRMEEHLRLCNDCRQDLELIAEAPTTVGDMPAADVEMPALLTQEFQSRFGSPAHKTTENLGIMPVLTRWFLEIFRRPVRMAYAVAVVAVLFLGLNLFRSGSLGFRSPMTPAPPDYISIEISHLSPENRVKFTGYLNKNNIAARIDGEKVIVERLHGEKAHSLLASFGKVESFEGSLVLEDDDKGSDFFYRLPGKASMLVVDEKGEFPKNAPSSVYGRQPAISAFSVLEDRESDEILKRYSQKNRQSLKTDMVERDSETTRIQDDFTGRAAKALKSHPGAASSPVRVYVTLSLNRDAGDKYRIQSVTVIIEKSGGFSESDKDEIKAKIRRALNWNSEWDETFLFVG